MDVDSESDGEESRYSSCYALEIVCNAHEVKKCRIKQTRTENNMKSDNSEVLYFLHRCDPIADERENLYSATILKNV